MSDEIDALKAELASTREEFSRYKDGLSGLSGKTTDVSRAFSGLGTSAGDLVGAMNSGAQGMSTYSGMVTAGAKALSTLTGEAGLAGKILGGLATATGGVTTAIFKQSDALFKSYQDISQIGAAGSSGMQGVFDNMQKFGYSIEELPKFSALLAQSSESLAVFGGTVEQGAKRFADVAEGIQRSGIQTEFQRMGMSVDSINKGMAGYLKIQTQTGAAQGKSNAELTAGAAAYIREMDIMTKLTGKSSEALQKEQEERLNNERYAIHQRELQQAVQRGGEEGLAAAKQLAEEDKILKQTSGETRKGFMATFAGFGATTEEGRKLMQTAPEAYAEAAKGIGTSANQTMDLLKEGAKRGMDQFGGTIKAAGNTILLPVNEMIAAENLTGTAEERRAAAEAAQKSMTQGAEASVANQVSIRQNQAEITRGMQSMVQIGVRPATAALEKFTGALQTGVTKLPGTGDKTGTRNTPGRGSTAPGVGSQGSMIDPEIIRQNQGTINKFNTPADIFSGFIKSFGALNNPAELARQGSDPGTMARILDRNNLGNTQYTGPNSTLPSPVGNTTPIVPAATPVSATSNTESGMLTTSINELIKSAALQQSSMDELVDLSRKSLAQNGKILQATRS